MKNITLLLLLFSCSIFAQKKQQSTYSVSLDLKNAMIAEGLSIQYYDGLSLYANNGGDQHLVIGDMGAYGYRTVAKSNNSTWFDFVDLTDTDLVRVWTFSELGVLIASYVGVSYTDWVKNGQTYTHTITVNGVNYVGVDSNLPNAMCKAFTLLINTL